MSKWSILFFSLVLSILFVLAVLSTAGVLGSSLCRELEDCDAFKPICAVYHNEHQFFYSQCDMVRENCWTGKSWKRDYFSHCNVA